MKVSVLIPTKNEPFISDLVENIHRNLSNLEHEIIIIDKSNIKPKVGNANVIAQKTDGLGMAIVEGLNHADGDVIVTMDGDGSHDPKDICKLIEKSDKYDIVIGSRFINGGKTEDSLYRRVVSRAFQLITPFVLGLDIKDPMSGFAAIKKDVYEKLRLNPSGYKINTEILYKGRKHGFKSTEVPITFHKRSMGKPKPKIGEGIKALRLLWELRLGIR